MQRLSSDKFTYSLWGAGSLATYGMKTRYNSIVENRTLIRRDAVGYCPGELVDFRPKLGTMAVLFEPDNLDPFWTHLTREEFAACFPDVVVGEST